MEDILDDPKLAGVDGDTFRFFMRLLAMLNRTKNRTGNIFLDRFALNACTMREQRRHALRIARAGAAAGLYRMSEDGLEVSIAVGKWPELQGFAPAKPRRNPSVTPPPVPVPIPLPVPKKEAKETSGNKPSSDLVLTAGEMSGEDTLWEQVNSTFRSYMPRARGLVLSKSRRARMAKVEKEFGDGSAIGALNGYAAMHLTEPANGSSFNPLTNFNPETCWRACNVGKYLDANNAAEDLGLKPPYLPPDPMDEKAAQFSRMLQALRGQV